MTVLDCHHLSEITSPQAKCAAPHETLQRSKIYEFTQIHQLLTVESKIWPRMSVLNAEEYMKPPRWFPGIR